MKKIKIITIILVGLLLIPLCINFYVINSTKNKIYSLKNISDHYDYALVLGCSVHKDGTPSLMLKDRLDMAIKLYNSNMIDKIIVSGEHQKEYSEVDVMENYLIANNVEPDKIIRDNIGSSTGDSIVNYNNDYKYKKVIVVTQQYHLYRSLYIANKYNLNVIGIPAKKIIYGGQFFREIREILARCKDFIKFYNI